MNVYISEEIRWAAKYPFDKRSRELLEVIAWDINEYAEEDLRFLLDRAYERAANALDHKYSLIWDNDYQEVVAFYLALLIIRGVDYDYVYMVFSDTEARRAYDLMKDEEDENVIAIASNLGFHVENDKNGFFRLKYIEFIKISRELSAVHWKLYNFKVEAGRVYLNKRNLARLCSQKIKDIIYEMIKNIPSVPESIGSYSNRIREEKETMFRKIEKYDFTDVSEAGFPPCIKWLMSRIGSGLSHPGRFTLVTFLHRIGYSTDEIINVFRRVPDFSERMTRYQVEHILGMKGSRIEYSVPSCKKIKSYGFCFPDENCKYIRHPIQYLIRIKRRRK